MFRNNSAVSRHSEKLHLAFVVLAAFCHLFSKICISVRKSDDGFHDDDHSLPGLLFFHVLDIHSVERCDVCFALIDIVAITLCHHLVVEWRVVHGGFVGYAFGEDSDIHHDVHILVRQLSRHIAKGSAFPFFDDFSQLVFFSRHELQVV